MVASSRMEISIKDMPEVLAGMRNALANMLRELALDESPEVAQRLRYVATAFEVGTTEWPTRED